jgi:ABC-type bacteriocin/lantibiotic exporter with double-glycine peptidase domain
MVLSAYGIDKSERELVKSTKTSKISGCDEKNIVKTARRLGLGAYIKKNSSINELRRLVNRRVPVIVDWFSPEEAGHYSVVVGFDKDNIFLADPHFGKIRKHKISWFEERWFDMPFKNIIKKEIIVIEK